MQWVWLAAVAALVHGQPSLSGMVAGLVAPPEPGDLSAPVAILTDDNFEEALQSSSDGRPWIVKFYAPWCHHCQALAPVMEDAAVQVHNLRFAKFVFVA